MCSTLTMCSYGGFFNGQKANISNITTVNSILPGELAEALQTNLKIKNNLNDTHIDKQSIQNEDVMLLDCRSFLAYNFKHISGALNVNCTGLVKKRLQQGKATLVDMVTSEYGKEFLKSGKWAKAVVYDDCTTELEKLPSSHPLKIVLVLLHKQGKEAFLLKGGLKEFSQCYQNLLAFHSDHSDSVTNAIDRINSLAKYHQDITTNQPNPSCPLNVKATEVMPNVFLGNATDAKDEVLHDLHNIRYILNLTINCPNYFYDKPGYHYKQVQIEDSCKEDIKEIIPEAINFIDQARSNNCSVLIHCQGGVSRSPTVTIAYLMHTNKQTFKEAYELVKLKRPCIAPNLNFMGQLWEMDQRKNTNASQSDCLLKKLICRGGKE
ncbi:dual specificity protein phosphatase 10 [Hydra vulgaris]|uniref:protein-tyrosine-phosphatase n=1 Tax=Hydra vulgaris TaxID=6087 RepID=A0ABM4C1K9_HYDVU